MSIQTEAWNVEHNRLHHYNLNEERDPDLVQRNLSELRENKDLPVIAKYVFVLGAMLFWKWFYYAPNTYKELKINELLLQKSKLPENFDRLQSATIKDFLDPFSHFGKALRRIAPLDVLLFEVMGPMLMGRFLLLPFVVWAIGGPMLAQHALCNLVAAELLTNVHSFVTIVTNHGTCLEQVRFSCVGEIQSSSIHALKSFPSISQPILRFHCTNNDTSWRRFVHL